MANETKQQRDPKEKRNQQEKLPGIIERVTAWCIKHTNHSSKRDKKHTCLYTGIMSNAIVC
jgi:hypothetical protein